MCTGNKKIRCCGTVITWHSKRCWVITAEDESSSPGLCHTAQICHCSAKAATDDMWLYSNGCECSFFFFWKFYFIKKILLEYSWFTMLCQFQLYSKVNQLYVYIYPLFFRFFSHIGHYRVLSRVPCAILLYSRSLLFVCFIYRSVYMSIPISQLIPPPLTPW